jgi:hypothetical protein
MLQAACRKKQKMEGPVADTTKLEAKMTYDLPKTCKDAFMNTKVRDLVHKKTGCTPRVSKRAKWDAWKVTVSGPLKKLEEAYALTVKVMMKPWKYDVGYKEEPPPKKAKAAKHSASNQSGASGCNTPLPPPPPPIRQPMMANPQPMMANWNPTMANPMSVNPMMVDPMMANPMLAMQQQRMQMETAMLQTQQQMMDMMRMNVQMMCSMQQNRQQGQGVQQACDRESSESSSSPTEVANSPETSADEEETDAENNEVGFVAKDFVAKVQQIVRQELGKTSERHDGAEEKDDGVEAVTSDISEEDKQPKFFGINLVARQSKRVSLYTVGYKHLGLHRKASLQANVEQTLAELRKRYDFTKHIDIVCDATGFTRHTSTPNAVGHTGEHAQCVADIVDDKGFPSFLGTLKNHWATTTNRSPIALVICPWGKNRSIGAARIIAHILGNDGHEIENHVHLTSKLHRNKCGDKCAACTMDPVCEQKKKALDEAYYIWTQIAWSVQ